ncbi:DNA polymerase III subunit chi [Gammaproteobacteria bacterium]|nr:DNA polymerase III subunit chi [Gammaproteobacteria bacterium]
MTQVDFYILNTDSNDSRLRFICRITDKAIRAQNHVFINTTNEKDAHNLNKLLWTFSPGSFIPHVLIDKKPVRPPLEPVIVSLDLDQSNNDETYQAKNNWDLMINLAPNVPAFFSRYMRVIEVVDSESARKLEGRDRYRFYKDRGYTLKHHKI